MNSIKTRLAIFVVIGLIASCASLPKPGTSLDDIEFSIFPHIVKRDGKYFLQYQISLTENGKPHLVRIVYSDIIEGKAYYFFSAPISHFEKGQIIERSLEIDGLTDFAKRGDVYWLNKDKTEIKLKIE
ncbi:MAG: hypothetical protein HYZ44_02400 [Bacteroidetes bacterium]|nr:hypothetical protein [Bacteroidota bacterium]